MCQMMHFFPRRWYSLSGMNTIQIHISKSTCPFFNLAYEEYLFQTKLPDSIIFFWWRANPTVLIGRFQNPWKECNIQFMEQNNVHLIRRKSGGGTIYQDLGNSIFSFIGPKIKFSIDFNNQIILSSLKQKYGIIAEPTGRNDMQVNGRKISGAAFRHSNISSIHHGTLLLDLDMSKLSSILQVDKRKLDAKGVNSVAARVLNLKELAPTINHEDLGMEVANYFQCAYPNHTCTHVDVVEPSNPVYIEAFNQLHDWNWRFGKTPEFTNAADIRFDWGIIDMRFKVENGKISACTIFSDCLFPVLIEHAQRLLENKEYSQDGIKQAMTQLELEMKQLQSPAAQYIQQWETWLLQQL